MKIEGIIWLREIVDKLANKHQVEPQEVEEIFDDDPTFRFVEKGEIKGEDLYVVLGQTKSGRYLITLFIFKKSKDIIIVSSRTMEKKERILYGKR